MATSRELEIISRLAAKDSSISTAVQELLDLTSEAAASTTIPRSQALRTHLNHFWRALLEDVVVKTRPSEQAALVDFIRTLQQQKLIDPTTGDQLRFDQDSDKTTWTEVPNFGINVADYWNFNPNASSPDPEEETRYLNKVAFLAQLTSSPANFVPDPETKSGPFDFSLYALGDLRDAFEESAEPRAPNTTLLRAASLWMMYGADRLWANVQTKRDFRHKASNSNPAKEGTAYLKLKKEWFGFNKERWEIWVKGFENGKDTGDEEVRTLVEEALKQIERVEDQGWRLRDNEKYA